MNTQTCTQHIWTYKYIQRSKVGSLRVSHIFEHHRHTSVGTTIPSYSQLWKTEVGGGWASVPKMGNENLSRNFKTVSQLQIPPTHIMGMGLSKCNRLSTKVLSLWKETSSWLGSSELPVGFSEDSFLLDSTSSYFCVCLSSHETVFLDPTSYPDFWRWTSHNQWVNGFRGSRWSWVWHRRVLWLYRL